MKKIDLNILDDADEAIARLLLGAALNELIAAHNELSANVDFLLKWRGSITDPARLQDGERGKP